jgi:hypothetical protein
MAINSREPPVECMFREVIGRKKVYPLATYEKN